MPSWGPRKIKSNAHFYSVFKMIEEEVIESKDSVIEQLFVEVFKDKDAFIETMVENLKKVEEVELEMTGVVRRTMSEMDECGLVEPDDLDAKITELLDKFEGQDLVYTTKFFKVIYKAGQPNLAVAHPRIQKKAGDLSYPINFKGNPLKTDCAALTNMDSEVMCGRGNIGPVFCTLLPLKDFGEEVTKRILDKFNMEINIGDIDENPEEPSASQDFPFTQSQTEDTIKVCQVCRFATRDKIELKEHMNIHHQCEICSQFYATKKDLDHHSQNHMKVNCDECNAKVRKDEMISHKMNHIQLKTFVKKLSKPNAVKPATGYGLWQKEERKKIVETNPEMNFNQVSSELGRRWKLVENAMKAVWKKQALDFNERLKVQNKPAEKDDEQTEVFHNIEEQTLSSGTAWNNC